MLNWWVRDPLRRAGLRERRRIDKLSKSAQHIEDPNDAQLVRQQIQYMEAFFDSWGGRFLVWLGPWTAVAYLAATAFIWGLRSNWLRLALSLVAIGVYLAGYFVMKSGREQMSLTARVNGWS